MNSFKLNGMAGHYFRMTVPPRLDDTDMILSELIKRFELLSLPKFGKDAVS